MCTTIEFCSATYMYFPIAVLLHLNKPIVCFKLSLCDTLSASHHMIYLAVSCSTAFANDMLVWWLPNLIPMLVWWLPSLIPMLVWWLPNLIPMLVWWLPNLIPMLVWWLPNLIPMLVWWLPNLIPMLVWWLPNLIPMIVWWLPNLIPMIVWLHSVRKKLGRSMGMRLGSHHTSMGMRLITNKHCFGK